MAGITLANAETILAALIAAAPNAAGATTVSVAGKSVTYQSLDDLNDAISFWDAQCKRLSRGGIRVRGVSPL